ncbi:MAG: DUF2461 domain-containing protein [Bryobacteraceae bacterium]
MAARPIPKTSDQPPSPEAVPFKGIYKEAFQFLRDLKKHNDRDWFRERKHVYEEKLRRPMEALLRESAALARKRGFPLYVKDKNPVTRIYRDIRFSADKTPFHTFLGGTLRGAPPTSAHGEVYIHVTFGEPFVAAGYWMPERPFLQAWREQMTRNPKEFSQVLKALERSKLEWLEGYALKRMPKGFEQQAATPLESYFKKQVFIVRERLTERDIGSPAVVARIATFALAARPLLEYGWRLNYARKRDMLEE